MCLDVGGCVFVGIGACNKTQKNRGECPGEGWGAADRGPGRKWAVALPRRWMRQAENRGGRMPSGTV